MTNPRGERFVWMALAIVLAAVVGWGIWALWRGSRTDDALPVLGVVPEFHLTERSGRSVTRADLNGHPWVADFVYTSCAGVCPLLSTRMATLRRELRDGGLSVRSVSFSVDPSHDSVAVLREYADRYHADPEDWLFLTGEHDAMYRLIGKGFLLSVAERQPNETLPPSDLITHSDRFVLVDGSGQIRAYYRGTDEDLISRVLGDVRKLERGS